MWMNSYVEDTLIRERLAEAQREGGRRQLVRSAGSATAPRHPWAFLQHLAEAISTLWPKSGKERMVDRRGRGQHHDCDRVGRVAACGRLVDGGSPTRLSETVFPAYDPHRSMLYKSGKSHPKATVLLSLRLPTRIRARSACR